MLRECAVCAGLAVVSFVVGTAVSSNASQAPAPSTTPSSAASAPASAAASATPTALPTPTTVQAAPSGGSLMMPTPGSPKPTGTTAAKKMYCN